MYATIRLGQAVYFRHCGNGGDQVFVQIIETKFYFRHPLEAQKPDETAADYYHGITDNQLAFDFEVGIKIHAWLLFFIR
jgi:hypothetical protein